MTKHEFEQSYIKKSDLTLDDYNLNFVTLECNCGAKQCRGWAAVSNNPRSIKSHTDLYIKDSDND